ncbi:MAG TPA: lipocalin family protein [Flavobacteriaceae bacterium]|nr:lipocalin family protein [Flavobacteriaceae bacterium]
MKILKPLVCLLFLSLVFSSCSNDDDVVLDKNGEKIIGTWRLFEIVEDGEPLNMGTCLPQSTVEFKAEGIFVANLVSDEPNEGGGCLEQTNTGQWKYLGDNEFETTSDGETEIQKIIFSENGTVFGITTEYDDGAIVVDSFVKID